MEGAQWCNVTCRRHTSVSTTDSFKFYVKKCRCQLRTAVQNKMLWAITPKSKNFAEWAITSSQLLSLRVLKTIYEIWATFSFRVLSLKLTPISFPEAIQLLWERQPKRSDTLLVWELHSWSKFFSNFSTFIKRVARYRDPNLSGSQRLKMSRVFLALVVPTFYSAHCQSSARIYLKILIVLLDKFLIHNHFFHCAKKSWTFFSYLANSLQLKLQFWSSSPNLCISRSTLGRIAKKYLTLSK